MAARNDKKLNSWNEIMKRITPLFLLRSVRKGALRLPPQQPNDGGLLPRRGFLTLYIVRTPQSPLPQI